MQPYYSYIGRTGANSLQIKTQTLSGLVYENKMGQGG